MIFNFQKNVHPINQLSYSTFEIHIFLYHDLRRIYMKFQLVDPCYCVTTDLTYHKNAIYDGVHALYPDVSINVHRYYFEIKDESSEFISKLSQMNREIAVRDPYLNSLFKLYPTKVNNHIIISPLLFQHKK